MSGHGANPIFSNKKIKIGRPEHSLTPTPLRPITSHFYLKPPPPQSGRHMCITLSMYELLDNTGHLKILISYLKVC